jgi:hypothetical protein
MQLIISIVLLIVALALVCWAIVKGNCAVRLLTVFATIVLASYIGFGFGTGWEKLRCADTYIYRFGQYSAYLHEMVDRQQINELTNNIVLFDTRFQPHQYEPKVLEDTMFQILKLGPYYKPDTNVVLFPQTTNTTISSH